MSADWFRDKVLPGIVGALFLGLAAVIGNAITNGTVIRQIGGMTEADLSSYIESEQFQQSVDAAVAQALGLNEAFIPNIPAGAVVAVDHRNGCTGNWERFDQAEGRVIVGVDNERFQLPYTDLGALYQTGGSFEYTLEIDNLPPHTHRPPDGMNIWFHRSPGNGNHVITNEWRQGDTFPEAYAYIEGDLGLESVGAGLPIDITPRYIALYFCKLKESR